MATGITSNYFLSYPLSTDPVNVASDIENLANDLDLFFTNPALINNININGGSIVTSALIGNIFNTNATTLNVGGAATVVNIGNVSGKSNFAGDVNVATGKSYKVNDVEVLNATTLGSSIITSSLTSLGTVTTGTWSATTIGVNKGGTGLTSYVAGDILYASDTATLSKLAGVATGNSIISGGIGVAPSWGKIGLTTHITGTLPVENGGTGVTVSTGTGSTVLSDSPVFTGTPTSTTPDALDNSTKIATTAYVVEAVAEGGSGTIIYQDEAPTVGLKNGTLWVDKNG